MIELREHICGLLVCMLFSPCATAIAQPQTKLRAKPVSAFDSHVKELEKDYQLILTGKKPFLWVHEQDPEVQRRVRSGELVIVKQRDNIDIPGGIIHLWGISTFMPDSTLDDVVKLLRDYDRHKDVYPSVVDSKLLQTNGNTVRGYLRFQYRWRITIDSTSRVISGGSPIAVPRPAAVAKKDPAAPEVKWSEAAYGLNVSTSVVIEVTIENGKYRQAAATSRFVSLTPYCQPPGVYDVKSAALVVLNRDGSKATTPYVTDPSFPVKSGVKAGQRLDLVLYSAKFDDKGFWVGFEAVLNEREAEKKIAYWNDPVSGKKSSMKRNVSEKHFREIPMGVAVMLLNGWKATSGSPGSVDHEVLTVQRVE